MSAHTAAIEVLRAQGAAQTDPLRLRRAEALARRAAHHTGEARRLLDARLAVLVAELQARLAALTSPESSPPSRQPRAPGPLAALVAQRIRSAGVAAASLSAAGHDVAATAPAWPDSPAGLGQLRATWARLSAERRLAQSRERLPDNAGPLNSQHLVHRTLALMHGLSPECLQHFMAQMDGLMWLEQVAQPPRGA